MSKVQIRDSDGVTLHDGLVCWGDLGVTLPCCASPAWPPAAPAPPGAAGLIPPAAAPPLPSCALSPAQEKSGEMGQPQQPGVYWGAQPTCGCRSLLWALCCCSSCSFSRRVPSLASSSSLISCSRYLMDSSWALLFSSIFSWSWRCLPARTCAKGGDG